MIQTVPLVLCFNKQGVSTCAAHQLVRNPTCRRNEVGFPNSFWLRSDLGVIPGAVDEAELDSDQDLPEFGHMAWLAKCERQPRTAKS